MGWSLLRRLLTTLSTMLIVGLILLLIGEALELGGTEQSPPVRLLAVTVRDAGIAVIIAFALAVTIDGLFRQRALTDVAEAAFGYLLPSALKEELLWMFQLPFLCEDHLTDYEFVQDGENLIMKTEIRRTIRNISAQRQPLTLGRMYIDEWGLLWETI